jgi:hypothetical protein
MAGFAAAGVLKILAFFIGEWYYFNQVFAAFLRGRVKFPTGGDQLGRLLRVHRRARLPAVSP